jgi:hypothetical protein
VALSEEEEDKFKRSLFRYLLYKVGNVEMGVCCTGCCSKSFRGKGVNEALRFSARLYYAVLILMGMQVCVTLFETVFDCAYTLPNGKKTKQIC